MGFRKVKKIVVVTKSTYDIDEGFYMMKTQGLKLWKKLQERIRVTLREDLPVDK